MKAQNADLLGQSKQISAIGGEAKEINTNQTRKEVGVGDDVCFGVGAALWSLDFWL